MTTPAVFGQAVYRQAIYSLVAIAGTDGDPSNPWDLTVLQMRAYLVDTSASDAEIADALQAERYAQAARCRIEPYTPDLLQALKRRVARNLAARRVPVASLTSFDGGTTSTRVQRVDPEVSRLEAPYRRMTVG